MKTCVACCLTTKGVPSRSQQSRLCAFACESAAHDMTHYTVTKGGASRGQRLASRAGVASAHTSLVHTGVT